MKISNFQISRPNNYICQDKIKLLYLREVNLIVAKMDNNLTTTSNTLQNSDEEYVKLVSHISVLWDSAKDNAALAINTELLDAIGRQADTLWNLSKEATEKHVMENS